MGKLLLLFLTVSALVGCPATFNANVRNESNGHIVVVPPFKSDFKVKIGEAETEKVSWYQECITIIDGNKKLFFKGWPIPSNVIQTHIFSSSLNVRYKEEKLYFENNKGSLYPIKQINKCNL